MVRFLQIMFFICTAVLLTGCDSPEDRPIWEQVKLRDVASPDIKNTGDRLLKTINLDIHIFEMPAEDIGKLSEIWQNLYTKPLEFNNYDAFCDNSFLIGFGQIQMWNKIAAMLLSAGAQKGETVSLLLPGGQASDFTITGLGKDQTVFYIASDGYMKEVTVGPGKIVLRIKVEKIPGSRGVCEVNAQPVFTLPLQTSIPQLVAQAKLAEVPFASVGFSLKMSPGDFILLGPERYIENQITLDGLFFSRPGPIPTVRMFLLVCTRIID